MSKEKTNTDNETYANIKLSDSMKKALAHLASKNRDYFSTIKRGSFGKDSISLKSYKALLKRGLVEEHYESWATGSLSWMRYQYKINDKGLEVAKELGFKVYSG